MSVLGDDLRPVEPGSGQVGLLARRGHIPLGYYKDEAKTAATFVTDPDGVRWSVPGDHARIEADGTITLLGRGSGCINTGGEKVYPEEVEAAVKSHPDVFDVVVVGVPDARFTERVVRMDEHEEAHSRGSAERPSERTCLGRAQTRRVVSTLVRPASPARALRKPAPARKPLCKAESRGNRAWPGQVLAG